MTVTTTPDQRLIDAVASSRLDAGPAARMLSAGRSLIASKGAGFTTHDLVGEAGVALQTFYNYFGSKDQLLLTLIGELIREHCANLVADARGITDPVARLEMYVRSTLAPLLTPDRLTSARFVTSEHWRLHQMYPAAVWAATQPVTDLIRAEIEAGATAGSLAPRNPERDSWLMTKTVIGAYHHHAFQADDPGMETLADDVWWFCLAAVGGQAPRDRTAGG